MPRIAWDETLPAAGTTASTVDDQLRSDVTTLATVIGTSFYWPGSAETQGASTASSGELRPGTARPSIGSALRVGNSPNGTLLFDSAVSRLYHGGSENTVCLGGQNIEEHAVTTGLGNARWVVQSDSTSASVATTSVTTLRVTFAPTYTIAPFLYGSFSSSNYLWAFSTVTAGGFSADVSYFAGAAIPLEVESLYWWSEGTVAY